MQNKTIGTSEKRIPQTKKQLQFQFYFIRLLFDAQAAHSRTDRKENILLCSIFETLLFEIQIDLTLPNLCQSFFSPVVLNIRSFEQNEEQSKPDR